ncbi:MAG TPA: prefoldin subunit alpha [Candidatus Nanoarchaeia archaeon]|nr:prefoldin subunit alpha [Candidatus Nanoarchaeia archaeon]
MEKKEALQSKYLEMKMMEQQIAHIQANVRVMEQQMVELVATIDSLDSFKELKVSSEILVPINNGIFTKALLKKEDVLLLNVGADVVVEKSVDGTKELLRRQFNELKEAQMELVNQLQQLVNYATHLEKEIADLAAGLE